MYFVSFWNLYMRHPWTGNRYKRSDISKKTEKPTNDNKCRLCKVNAKDVTHTISSCSKMFSQYYQPIRHDVIAKYLYEAIRKNKDPKWKIENKENEFIDQDNGTEYWWNVSIKTAVKIRHNQPDLVIWEIENKNCHIIESSCPADVNRTKKAAEKL